MRANALVVMAKVPLAGQVKTRLVPPLTPEEAAELCRALLLDLLEGLRRFQVADLFLAFTPAEAAPLFAEIAPSGLVCFPQRGDDLGERWFDIDTPEDLRYLESVADQIALYSHQKIHGFLKYLAAKKSSGLGGKALNR